MLAELVVHTTSAFMDRWAAGAASWDDGLSDGDVILSGHTDAWPPGPDGWTRWLAATGYLLAYTPETTDV